MFFLHVIIICLNGAELETATTIGSYPEGAKQLNKQTPMEIQQCSYI